MRAVAERSEAGAHAWTQRPDLDKTRRIAVATEGHKKADSMKIRDSAFSSTTGTLAARITKKTNTPIKKESSAGKGSRGGGGGGAGGAGVFFASLSDRLIRGRQRTGSLDKIEPNSIMFKNLSIKERQKQTEDFRFWNDATPARMLQLNPLTLSEEASP